jgi:hypothetical protein
MEFIALSVLRRVSFWGYVRCTVHLPGLQLSPLFARRHRQGGPGDLPNFPPPPKQNETLQDTEQT